MAKFYVDNGDGTSDEVEVMTKEPFWSGLCLMNSVVCAMW
jgi:hypothetical protein